MKLYNSQPACNNLLNTDFIVNHNKYTFQYIIHIKYWKTKSQHRSLEWMQGHVSIHLTMYALARLIWATGYVDATDCLKAVWIFLLNHAVAWEVPATWQSNITIRTLASIFLIIKYGQDICKLGRGTNICVHAGTESSGERTSAAYFTIRYVIANPQLLSGRPPRLWLLKDLVKGCS